MDFVAARSFPVGGMENWGLIIFHNKMILLDSFFEGNERCFDMHNKSLYNIKYKIIKI